MEAENDNDPEASELEPAFDDERGPPLRLTSHPMVDLDLVD